MRELFSYPGNCSPHPFLVFGLLIEKQTSELSSSLLCAVSMFPFNKVVKTFLHAWICTFFHSSTLKSRFNERGCHATFVD